MNDQAPRVITIPAGTGTTTLRVIHDLITFTLCGDQTQRAFSLFFDQVPPGGGVPAHTQRGQESFIMFDGELEFSVQDGTTRHTFTATRGTVIHVPEGAAHAYRNASTAPASFFVIFAPSGSSERFFERLGVPVRGPDNLPSFAPPDPKVLQALLEELGIRIVSSSPQD
jgi:mannose-6-phosphate isomerase-like protein (cupin superfamily)